MKLLNKWIKPVLAIIMLFNINMTNIFAEENPDSESENQTSYTELIDGDVYEFDSYETYLRYLNNHETGETSNLLTSDGTDYYSTQIYSKMVYYQWIGYHSHTPYWSTASQYSVGSSESCSASGSISSDGYLFNVSVTYTQTVTIYYSADASRYSKLDVYADVRLARYRYDVYEYGTYSYTYYVNTATPIERYITVVYRW